MPISDVFDWGYTGNWVRPTQKPLRALTPPKAIHGSSTAGSFNDYVTLVWPVFIVGFLPNEALAVLPDYAV
jgi:hypothetical protein